MGQVGSRHQKYQMWLGLWPKLWKEREGWRLSSQLLSRVQLFAILWLKPTRLLCPWNSPGKNIGVGCHPLLQRIILTQRSNSGFLHCRQILYQLSHQCLVNHAFIMESQWKHRPPKHRWALGWLAYRQALILREKECMKLYIQDLTKCLFV